MTDKEIRHLSKTELLAIIRDQERELQQVKQQAAEQKRQLEDRRIRLEKCGSIAQASMQLHQVFETAQAAADQYLAEVREKQEGLDAETDRILAEAREKADAQVRASEEAGRKIEEESRQRANAYWAALQEKLEAVYRSHQGLKEMLASGGIDMHLPSTGVKREDDESEGTASQS